MCGGLEDTTDRGNSNVFLLALKTEINVLSQSHYENTVLPESG